VSFKVLVVPEDPTHNGAILKPLVEALMVDAGKAQATVRVLDNPRVQGFDDAVEALRGELVDRYRWMDLWLFMPDADRARPDAMAALEATLQAQGVRLLCCAAQSELEIFASAPYRAEIPGGWAQARRHGRFKEVIFAPLIEKHGDARRPAGGRDLMIAAALANLQQLYGLCPELKQLRDRIAALLAGAAP
jgi:hypothetical protein